MAKPLISIYVTVLRRLSETCEFGILKNSLVRDRIVLGISETKTRERLLRIPDLTLEKATVIVNCCNRGVHLLCALRSYQVEFGLN